MKNRHNPHALHQRVSISLRRVVFTMLPAMSLAGIGIAPASALAGIKLDEPTVQKFEGGNRENPFKALGKLFVAHRECNCECGTCDLPSYNQCLYSNCMMGKGGAAAAPGALHCASQVAVKVSEARQRCGIQG